MDKRHWNQFRSKNRYRDEHVANTFRRKYEIERAKKLDYYYCVYCHGYHLTSKEFRPEGYGISSVWVANLNNLA